MNADTAAPPWTLGGRAQPLIWGHRGADHRAPDGDLVENTLPAFARALAAGADGVELDVRLCAGGEVVVFHDDDLTRVAGRPERVDELDLSALQAIPLAEGARVPTLAEVLAAVPALVNVEIKPPPTRRDRRAGPGRRLRVRDHLARATVDVIAAAGAEDRVIVSSFDPLILAAVRARAPHLARGYLFHAEQSTPLRQAWLSRTLRPHALHPDVRLVDRRRVRAWRRRGVAINVWTVDDPDEIVRLSQLGVDGIITNRPAAARAALAR
ncbi:glycerophosphodiester phosphodiesterase [Haliangium sp.]|uniref:glycerophosphodiester phosphodiesterase n=1 Tax=Haliangium sp. TaxID=2663208 RepID=UPI003D0A134A